MSLEGKTKMTKAPTPLTELRHPFSKPRKPFELRPIMQKPGATARFFFTLRKKKVQVSPRRGTSRNKRETRVPSTRTWKQNLTGRGGVGPWRGACAMERAKLCVHLKRVRRRLSCVCWQKKDRRFLSWEFQGGKK